MVTGWKSSQHVIDQGLLIEAGLPLILTGPMAQKRPQVVPAHFLRAERRSIP
jgi:hypothetical protein